MKIELITWVKKWDVLRGKNLKCKEMMKRLLLKNQILKRQNRINRTMAVKFRAKLNESRKSVPIQFSVESALKTWYFVFQWLLNFVFCILHYAYKGFWIDTYRLVMFWVHYFRFNSWSKWLNWDIYRIKILHISHSCLIDHH